MDQSFQEETTWKVPAAMSDMIVRDGSVDLKGNPSIRSKTGTWKAAPFIYGVVLGDTVGVLGILGNLIVYLGQHQHLPLAESVNIISYFMGTTYLLPLFWAFLADAYFGRFWILALSASITSMGLVVLTISAALPGLQAPTCVPSLENQGICPRATAFVLSWMYAGLYLTAVGSAGLKPTVASLGQDQFDQTDPAEKKQGQHFFTGFYVVTNASGLINVTILFYIQSKFGFDWGYGVGAAIVVISACFFLVGTPFYRHIKPAGSPVIRLAQVVVVALKNLKQPLPGRDQELHELQHHQYRHQATRRLVRTDRLRFLDKAAIETDNKAVGLGPWNLCTVTQVEELKSVLQVLPIWLCTASVYIVFSQMITFSTQQAVAMDRKMGRLQIPAASIVIFMLFSALAFIPIYEGVIVPLLRRFTGEPRGCTYLQRIGFGMFLAVFALIIAALVEQKKVDVVKDNNLSLTEIVVRQNIPMSAAWLIPQYAILGIVEFLVGVSQLNFFYTQFPDNMRSVATSLFFSSVSLGYFLSTVIVDLVNKHSGGWLAQKIYTGGLRDYFWLLAITQAIILVFFVILAHWYTYKALDETTPNDEALESSSMEVKV